MWEKDKKLLRAFKECFTGVEAQLKAGEEVDLTTVCQSESEALIAYTIKAMDYYKSVTPLEVPDKKSRYYTPMQPYFQNL
jgi:hypothetical protein